LISSFFDSESQQIVFLFKCVLLITIFFPSPLWSTSHRPGETTPPQGEGVLRQCLFDSRAAHASIPPPAVRLPVLVNDYRPQPFSSNPLTPSGVSPAPVISPFLPPYKKLFSDFVSLLTTPFFGSLPTRALCEASECDCVGWVFLFRYNPPPRDGGRRDPAVGSICVRRRCERVIPAQCARNLIPSDVATPPRWVCSLFARASAPIRPVVLLAVCPRAVSRRCILGFFSPPVFAI